MKSSACKLKLNTIDDHTTRPGLVDDFPLVVDVLHI